MRQSNRPPEKKDGGKKAKKSSEDDEELLLDELTLRLGLDVDQARAVVVKTASNFQYFDDWRRALIRVDSPGMTQSDLSAFTWTRTPRPIFPFDVDVTWEPDVGGNH